MWRRVALLSPFISSSSKSLGNLHREMSYGLTSLQFFTSETGTMEKVDNSFKEKYPFIAFVLGGPGSGKGTQCAKIAETFKCTHLSAGDLLRKEIASDGENGAIICDIIKEGRIVPSEVTVKLIQNAIESSESHKFIIDGFPRSDENRIAFERIIGAEPNIVLYFECPEEEMVKRVLSRNQGRIDDNIETIKIRLKVFAQFNLPVIDYYSGKGKLHKINAAGTEEEVFEKVCMFFSSYSGSLNVDPVQQ